MELKEQLKNIFHSDFPGINVFINNVIQPIFGNDIIEHNEDFSCNDDYAERAEKAGIKHLNYVADITDDKLNSYNIGLFDVTLDDSKDIERSRVNIQQLIRSIVQSYTHILIVFHYENVTNKPWRFSYAYKTDTIAHTTSAKRFTYVFGQGFTGRTAVERFVKLANSQRNDADFVEAFSVESLSDEFFDKYREHYADFVQYITGKRYEKEGNNWVERELGQPDSQYTTTFNCDDKLVRDYIKKMFGRIVFLYFLQRKGWLNGDLQYMHNLFYESTAKDNFLDGVLEPLFFEVLNTDKQYRTAVANALPGSDNIPYLNGGLFARDEIDELDCIFPEEYFKKLFDFLDSYNFTIDENDVDDAEIGIDPEMLGRIFENLLEDNKDKGAFYTPKEIVNYMCRESLIAYLQNGVPERSHELIRNFVEDCDASQLNDDQVYYLRKKLQEVKICDPAIGSGAFPMGLVNILSRLYIAMKADTDTSKMKRHIIENCIYGVDIEKGAVDIARLRFWLAMIVEEKEPMPLPNLHFKIMQGNSLLESYNGKDLSSLTEVNIGGPGTLNLESEDAKQLIANLKRFYNESRHDERQKIFNNITNNVRRQIFDLTQSEDFMEDVKDISANEKFFLWHTWFADVFDKGGFDIVIGNPPYIQLQKSIGISGVDKKGREFDMKLGNLYENERFSTFTKKGDIYCLFYEQGYKLLKSNGHLCYITSNKWMRADYGNQLRDFLSKNVNPIRLIDFAGVKIFDNATVDTNILLIEKSNNSGETKCVSCAGSKKETILKNLSLFVQQNSSVCQFSNSDSWVILSPIELSIKRKIEAVGTPLKDWDIQINYGIKTGYNEAFIISTEKRNEILANCQTEDERTRTAELIRPILRGRDIKRYGYDWANLWLINTHNGIKGKLERIHIEDYPAIKAHLDKYWDKISKRTDKGDTPYNLRNCAYLEDFSKPKVVYPETTQGAYFVYDTNGFYIDKTCFMLLSKDAKYIQQTLSSSLFEFAYKRIFASVELGEHGYQYNKHALIKLPILRPNDDIIKNIKNSSFGDYIYFLYNINEIEKQFIKDYIEKL